MGNKNTKDSAKLSTLTALTEDNKRWLVFGIALNHVLVPSIRPVLEQEILKEYNDLKTNHGIDVQTSHSFPVPRYLNVMKYENINANDTKLKPPHYKKLDFSKFDYQVTSHVDFAKLFLQNYMAKFNAFNETCDGSAVLNLFGKIPVFSVVLQNAANVVREGRNAWGHCNFTEWNEADFKTRFCDMKQLVKEIGFPSADESKVITDLKDWEDKGTILCMNATIDPQLAKVVQEHISQLSGDVEKIAFETQEELNNFKMLFKNIELCLHEWMERITKIELDQSSTAIKMDQLTTNQEVLQQEQSSTAVKVHQLTTNQEILQQEQSSTAFKVDQLEFGQKAVEKRMIDLESQTSSLDFSSCEADINYNAQRYDPDTRQWLLKDFDTWFRETSESRAYVLLGDAAVGKSVMAAVIAKRARDDGNLAAAYFCRHYDGTRRDPRYLLGTIAHQLGNCNAEYDRVVGGDTGILRMLANNKLGVHELFTKLLEEPLGKCSSCKRKLVVIDALDETEYWSREDFLVLIMNRFPQLPKWLVFFITSRPEDTVQFRLKTYNPCIRICAGNSDSADFYQQHEQDIQRFLVKRIDFSTVPYAAEDLTKTCNGMFLYAFYIVEFVKNSTRLDGDIFPENINTFFYNNFKRVHEKIGYDLYKKLFGCALVAPSPLPVSFISFILQGKNSSLDEQEVIDAISQFVTWRTSEKTFAFLHNLIPAWLTDKERALRKLFIDKNSANEYFEKIIVEFLNSYLKEQKEFFSCVNGDLVDYFLENGIRFLCNYSVEPSGSSEVIFNCLSNYRFLKHRVTNKIGIYSLIEDFRLSTARQDFNEKEKTILKDICSAIEQDRYVIAGNPELLYSCLRNATKLSQESILSGDVSISWMELHLDLTFSVEDVFKDMRCGAFSHDKKLFAGAKDGSIYLYDASSFRKVSGPFEVMSEDILHLEFSSDDRFVFFGKLDAWFSMQEKLVVEITQFSENSKCYEWGSFIYEGKFIAVRQKLTLGKHNPDCFKYIFYKWIVKEFDEGRTRENMCREFSLFRIGGWRLEKNLEQCLVNIEEDLERIKQLGLCPSCAKFEKLETPVCDRIVLLYADIFEHQIWNVQTGRPVIEEMFYSQVKLKPFFYLWHFFPAMNGYEDKICVESMTLGNVAVLNLLFWCDIFPYIVRGHEEVGSIYHPDNRFTYFVNNTPVECCDYTLRNCSLSKNRMWLAGYGWKKTTLFVVKIRKGGKGFPNDWQYVDLGTAFLGEHAFTNDSDILIYRTHCLDHDSTLFALCVNTRIKLRSISGFHPVRFESGEGHAVGYIFFGCGEKRTVLLRDLPWKLVRDLTRSHAKSINVAFTSNDRIIFVCSNAVYMSLEIAHYAPGINGAFSKQVKLNHEFSKQVHVKKCIFSNDGKLVAIHESCQLLLFHGDKFLCTVFKVEDNCEHTITCLTFSPDDCLLSFFIQRDSGVQSFYVWDVQKQDLSGPIACPYRLSADCCCFSFDNTKLILSNAYSVLILEDPPTFGRFSKLYDVPYVDYRTSQLCTHCTVSSDDKLLACCVANEILIYPLNGPDAFWKVQHNHLGRIEFCKFLKGNRYLISFDIDCVVALFDIYEWKSIAYTRLQESIISMAKSPNEEKIVCLTSYGDASIIKLHGLKYGLPSDFQLPSNFGLPEKSRSPPTRQTIEPRIETEFEGDGLMQLSYSDFYESSDENVSD